MPEPTPLNVWGEQPDGTFVTPYYYTQADLAEHGRRTGVSETEEADAVRRTTTIISRVSRRLKLPGKTYAITSVLLHRFYAVWPRKSLQYTEEQMICACIDLACKLQETPIRLPQISHHVLSEMRGEKLTEEEARAEMEYKLSPHQQKLLESLQFNVDIVHPFRSLACFIAMLEGVTLHSPASGSAKDPKEWLYGFCSGMILDSYRITLCIQYPPHIIAMASLYLAQKLLDDVAISPAINATFMARCECDWKNVEDAALQIVEMYATNHDNTDNSLIIKAKLTMEILLDRRRRRESRGHFDIRRSSPTSTMTSSFIESAAAVLLSAWTVPLLYNAAPRFVAPVYGHFLATQHHLTITVTFILVATLGAFVKARKASHVRVGRLLVLVSLLLAAAPGIMRRLFTKSGEWGPHSGPLLTMSVVYIAIAFIASITVFSLPQTARQAGAVVPLVALLAGSLSNADRIDAFTRGLLGEDTTTCDVLKACCWAWTALAFIDSYGFLKPQNGWDGWPTGKYKAVPAAVKTASRKKGKRASVAAASTSDATDVTSTRIILKILLLTALLITPHLIMKRLPGGLQCDLDAPTPDKYELLAFQESNTGYIYVIQDNAQYGGVRMMRCDHSLIGGAYPNSNFDSTFGSFYFLDYVQYVKRPPHAGPRKALQIGLGIGASTRMLVSYSDVKVDLVELDPVVVSFARQHFDLPSPNSVHIGDGRAFLDSAPHGTYDFVLHDVFTGGLVPGRLFSFEALSAVRRVLRPDGILALNFVGTLDSPGTRTLLKTIKTVFTHYECYTEDLPSALEDAPVYNMVFYASPQPIKFQIPSPRDLPQPSDMYKHFLEKFTKHRVTTLLNELDASAAENPGAEPITIVTDAANPLAKMQYESALAHWSVMRKVFSDEFWTSF
ncbi:hypothetical protein HDU86_003810 [Geranomyces michiganensis]|nr:hypothetical protein HDU86_003810 [Geranomyces michiganensis]